MTILNKLWSNSDLVANAEVEPTPAYVIEKVNLFIDKIFLKTHLSRFSIWSDSGLFYKMIYGELLRHPKLMSLIRDDKNGEVHGYIEDYLRGELQYAIKTPTYPVERLPCLLTIADKYFQNIVSKKQLTVLQDRVIHSLFENPSLFHEVDQEYVSLNWSKLPIWERLLKMKPEIRARWVLDQLDPENEDRRAVKQIWAVLREKVQGDPLHYPTDFQIIVDAVRKDGDVTGWFSAEEFYTWVFEALKEQPARSWITPYISWIETDPYFKILRVENSSAHLSPKTCTDIVQRSNPN